MNLERCAVSGIENKTEVSSKSGVKIAPRSVTKPAKPARISVAKAPVSAVDASPSQPNSAAPVRTAPPAAPIAPPVIPAAAPIASKEAMMETVTDKTQAMFAGLNDRAKGAMEKSTHLVEEMTAFGKGNVEALVETSKIAAKSIETLGQDVADYAKTSFESATAAAKTLAAAKSPTEFMTLQSEYARTAFDTMIAEGSRSTERMLKMFGEIAQPMSNRVAVATQKMKISA